MKKYLLLSLLMLLFLGTSCKDDETPNIFAGTTWKGKIDMKSSGLPSEYKDGQKYYTLKFLSKNEYMIVLEDENGVILEVREKGTYEILDNGGKIYMLPVNLYTGYTLHHRNSENELYIYYGVSFIKQI